MTTTESIHWCRNRHRQPSGVIPLFWNLAALVLVIGVMV